MDYMILKRGPHVLVTSQNLWEVSKIENLATNKGVCVVSIDGRLGGGFDLFLDQETTFKFTKLLSLHRA